MKHIVLPLLVLLLAFSCDARKTKLTALEQLIPESSQVILKINDIEVFKSDFNNNHFISVLQKTKPYQGLKNKLNDLCSLQIKTPFYICIERENENFSYTIVTQQASGLSDQLKSLNYFTKTIDSIQLGSTSKEILNTIIPTKNIFYNTYFKTTNPKKSFSVLFSKLTLNHFFNQVFVTENNYGDWLTFDVNLTQNKSTLNGVLTQVESNKTLLNIFNNSIAQENTIQKIAPQDAYSILSATYSDYGAFYEQLNVFNTNKKDSTVYNEVFENINEVSKFNVDKDEVIVIHSLDETLTSEALAGSREEFYVFRDIPIYRLKNCDLFKNSFYPIFENDSLPYYTKVNDHYVFSKNKITIEHIISSYQNGKVLANYPAFKSCFDDLSDESSLLVFKSDNALKALLNKWLNTNNTPKLDNYEVTAFQLIKDDNFTHFNAVINHNKHKGTKQGITEEFDVKLESEILTLPQFVINHKSKQKEIIVQDINNKLYLISNSGKVLWTKIINGKLLGKVNQVDLYNNGRLQLAFATSNRVYILDRNGKNVAPFPKKFNDDITQPLAVFDYDNNKNYRFLITQGDELLMLNKKGKRVAGFKYKNKERIYTHPKHFRIGNKDFIVFVSGNRLKILNRKGQPRINVSENITFSDNPIFLYKNAFTGTTKNGRLVQVNLKGAVSYVNLGLENNHKIDATSKTLATLFENKLTIKEKTYELDFGNYTSPQIFYLNDKIYVSTTDLQAKKIFLFDSQARLQNNFPVYGNASIELSNIDKDKYLEFVTIGDNNSVLVYQKN